MRLLIDGALMVLVVGPLFLLGIIAGFVADAFVVGWGLGRRLADEFAVRAAKMKART